MGQCARRGRSGGLEAYRAAAKVLGEELDPLDIAAAAFKLLAAVDRRAELSHSSG